jgi:hypothetical protein
MAVLGFLYLKSDVGSTEKYGGYKPHGRVSFLSIPL